MYNASWGKTDSIATDDGLSVKSIDFHSAVQ